MTWNIKKKFNLSNFKKGLLQKFTFFFYLTGKADRSLFVNPDDLGDAIVPDGMVGPTASTGSTGPAGPLHKRLF